MGGPDLIDKSREFYLIGGRRRNQRGSKVETDMTHYSWFEGRRGHDKRNVG